MSKIGKQPIRTPKGVEVQINDQEITIKGPLGELRVPRLYGVEIKESEGATICALTENSKQTRSNWGTQRALMVNAVEGVTKGFEKTLIVEGVGYKTTAQEKGIELSLGYSHPIKYVPPEGITLEVGKGGTIKVKGIDKALVGEIAASIRRFKKPEPYKGKGIRYSDEIIRRKVGKKAATAAE
jgi:large subunit ribosomal protein L6